MTVTHAVTPTGPERAGRAGIGWAASDAVVMVQRSIRHLMRDLDSMLMSALLPVMLLLLFVYVFGGAITTGGHYVNYVVPGIIVLCAGYGASSTAIRVCTDMTGGMIDRFRSMPIRSSAAVMGHVVASLARNLFSTVIVVVVALLCGFHPTAGVGQWAAALGIISLYVLAISWLSVVTGLVAGSVESAAALGFVLLFLPYLSSAFVPTDTMPHVLRPIAAHQPVTPLIETIRGLLVGGPVGHSALVTVAWCLGTITVVAPLSAHLLRTRTRG